jgi:hypothetical protein
MSYNATRFTSMNTVKLGACAPMRILESVLAERAATEARATAHANLMSEVDQLIFQAFYANRFASIAMNDRNLLRTDCLDNTTVTVYRTPRTYRRAAMQAHLINTHFADARG